MVAVRLCRLDEIGAVMAFLHRHWSADHVLSWHRPLMDWQHRDTAHPDRYNWVVAERGGDVIGVLGFIPTRHYDPALGDRSLLWLSLWKVRDDAGVAGLGLRLLKTLAAVEPHAAIGVLGIGSPLSSLYRALGYEVGALRQHAVFNLRLPRRLAAAPPGQPLATPRPGDAVFRRLDRDSIGDACAGLDVPGNALPRKTPLYFRRRYLEHPVYRYDVRLVEVAGRPAGLAALRLAEHEGARALRIVDFMGPSGVWSRCGSAVAAVMEETGAEYADILEYGLDAADLRAAGFALVEPAGPLVVPNHFEPFVPRNVRVEFAVSRPAGRPFVLFRGDGDQDRPNRVARSDAAAVESSRPGEP
ncbi:MAG: hypothetical protein HY927_15200 [Elusimicrobia bacterium]|nr:hypothetical protein [Elusimicrobiota bacterium]